MIFYEVCHEIVSGPVWDEDIIVVTDGYYSTKELAEEAIKKLDNGIHEYYIIERKMVTTSEYYTTERKII